MAVGDACPSDHVALWVDFHKQDLLGGRTENIITPIHKLKSDDPRMVNKYNRLSKKELSGHRMKEKLTKLASIPRHKWDDDNTGAYNKLHRINNDVHQKIASNIRTLCMGNIPWSPKLKKHFDQIELWKMIVRK